MAFDAGKSKRKRPSKSWTIPLVAAAVLCGIATLWFFYLTLEANSLRHEADLQRSVTAFMLFMAATGWCISIIEKHRFLPWLFGFPFVVFLGMLSKLLFFA